MFVKPQVVYHTVLGYFGIGTFSHYSKEMETIDFVGVKGTLKIKLGKKRKLVKGIFQIDQIFGAECLEDYMYLVTFKPTTKAGLDKVWKYIETKC